MVGYKTFTQAMDAASDACSLWKNVDTGIEYSYPELMILAGFLDKESILEDPFWYIVFPDGEIAFMNVYNEEICAMYRPLNHIGVQEKITGEEFYPQSMRTPEMEEAMENAADIIPEDLTAASKPKFCGYCGKPLAGVGRFCGCCGKKVG